MGAQNQNSIISYVPQPYFVAGAAALVGDTAIASIENSAGIFAPDLSDFATITPTSSAGTFAVQITFDKQSAHLADSNMTLALIGCSLLTYEDSSGAPDLATEFSEDIACYLTANITAQTNQMISFAHNSQDNISTFDQVPLPSVISGGRANLVFNGLGASNASTSATITASFKRTAANVSARPHAKLLIGHLFIGVDVSVQIDPQTFSWTLEIENERFVARDFGAINSDGTLVKRATGEIINIPNDNLFGSEITAIAAEIASTQTPNFFDLVKTNTSYPLLFNSYQIPNIEASGVTVDELNQTARQNFFSIYGFMQDPLELQPDEYRDALSSLYRARFRIIETR